MTTNTTRKCEHCQHYDAIQENIGLCRRHAPRPGVFSVDDDGDAIHPDWPQTLFDDWCGEWAAPPLEAEATR